MTPMQMTTSAAPRPGADPAELGVQIVFCDGRGRPTRALVERLVRYMAPVSLPAPIPARSTRTLF
jgi:hypothetical protein